MPKVGRSGSSLKCSRKREPFLAGLDSEDDGAGSPYLFCLVHERGSFSTPHAWRMREKLSLLASQLHEEGRYLEVWATNLEYDLVNLFGADTIREVTIRWGRSYLISARWRRIEFRDTVRHIPMGVKALGELVGIPKLTRDRTVAYCMRDAAITYRTGRELHATYQHFGVRPRTTLASSAYAVWSTQHFDARVYPAAEEIRETAREAYHGGRTEPFAIGDFRRVHVIDAASMFPWAMIQGEFPVPWGSYVRVPRNSPLEPTGLYRVRVRSQLDIPVLPFRTREGTVFPNGSWTGWYVGEELQYFQACGGTVDVLRGFEFGETVRPFDDYVRVMFRGKTKARGPLRLMYKLLLNALYGKFAQRGERVISVPLETFESMNPRPINVRIWNGLVMFEREGTPPPWGNVIWSALVTARARVRLHKEMLRVRNAGGRVLYCDTDSVMYTGAKLRYPAKATRPGQFESRGSFDELVIVGKKEYALRKGRTWELHAKGVPQPAREAYIRTGTATFQRPIRVREAAARGLQANVWTEHTKTRRVSFKHRVRTGDGTLAPIVIE